MATTAPGTTRTAPARRTEPLRLARTTGALSGVVVIALGIWGGLIPFVGPYFHYAFGGYQTWHYTAQRLWLDILPGIVAVAGGFMLLTAATRTAGLIGGWLAVAAGAWFAIGPVVSLLWHHTIYAIGTPAGNYTRQMLEWIGYFYGLGALIIGFAAFAMGRYFSRPRVVEEQVVAAEVADAPAADRARYAEPAAREGYAEPAAREGYAEPAASAPAGASTTAPAEAPTTANAAADVPAAGTPATTSYRRRPGLLRRLRGE